MELKPSPFLFQAQQGRLIPVSCPPQNHEHAVDIGTAINGLIGQNGYPCIPAQQALMKNDYLVGIYSDFGAGQTALLNDLLYFRKKQKESSALYLSFFAVYIGPPPQDETEFEQKFWQELTNVSMKDDSPWDPAFSSDPSDKRFCFSAGGEAFFTVGLHPLSSRKARRFPYPAIIFNLFEQFEELDRRGQYEGVVKANRKREMQFQGNLNPMVEKYADVWESIQFSGKENPPDWKCPFHHGTKEIR